MSICDDMDRAFDAALADRKAKGLPTNGPNWVWLVGNLHALAAAGRQRYGDSYQPNFYRGARVEHAPINGVDIIWREDKGK